MNIYITLPSHLRLLYLPTLPSQVTRAISGLTHFLVYGEEPGEGKVRQARERCSSLSFYFPFLWSLLSTLSPSSDHLLYPSSVLLTHNPIRGIPIISFLNLQRLLREELHVGQVTSSAYQGPTSGFSRGIVFTCCPLPLLHTTIARFSATQI